MAYVEFEGLDPATGSRVVTRVTMADEAMLSVVQAVCGSEGYTGDTPGLHTINRSIEGWMLQAERWQRAQGHAAADAAVDAAMMPLKVMTTTVNGEAL